MMILWHKSCRDFCIINILLLISYNSVCIYYDDTVA